MAYEQAYDNKKTATMALIKASMIEDSVMETSSKMLRYMQADNWEWAIWKKVTWERAAEKIAELEAEIAEWDAEMMAEMDGQKKEEKTEDAQIEKGEGYDEEGAADVEQ